MPSSCTLLIRFRLTRLRHTAPGEMEAIPGAGNRLSMAGDCSATSTRITRDQAEKQRVWAEAYEQKLWMEEPRQAFVLHMLRGIVGDETFLEIRDTYLALRHESGEAVPTPRFRDLAEEIHGEPLDWFFDQWLEREEVPELKLEGVQVERDGARNGWFGETSGSSTRKPSGCPWSWRSRRSRGRRTGRRPGTRRGPPEAREDLDGHEGRPPLSSAPQDRPVRIIVDPEFDLLKIQKMPPVLTTGYPDVLVVYGTLAEDEANKAAAESFRKGISRSGW
jgi:hypothetical protein